MLSLEKLNGSRLVVLSNAQIAGSVSCVPSALIMYVYTNTKAFF